MSPEQIAAKREHGGALPEQQGSERETRRVERRFRRPRRADYAAMIESNAGVLTSLLLVCATAFFVAEKTGWRLFTYFPPLLFIYMTPVALSNTGVIPGSSPVYDEIRAFGLPMMLVLLLIKVDVGTAVRVMGKGVFVMLFGTLGVVVGAPIAYLVVGHGLGPDGWKAFGSLAGSWIGGTGNLAGVSEMIGTEGTEFGLAVLADNLVYIVWLPIMLGSKNLAGWFGRFTGVSDDRLAKMEQAVESMERDTTPPRTHQYHYMLFVAVGVTWLANAAAEALPVIDPFVSTGTWRILLVTTFGVALSFTPVRKLPGSHEFAMALVYLYVARMGATASLAGEDFGSQAGWFVLGAFIWIFIHGAFCLLGARIFRVDVHTAAIASAANIGGAASAPIVAAHHKEILVPVSILMALIGYAVGNYAAYLAAVLCQLVA